MSTKTTKKICKQCNFVGDEKSEFYPRTKLCISCFKNKTKQSYLEKKVEIKDKRYKKSDDLVNTIKEIKTMLIEVKKENEELKQGMQEIKELKQDLQDIKSHLTQNQH